MTNQVGGFRVGEFYSNDEIHNSLSVGNAGGIRVALDEIKEPRRIVIFTSSPDARQLNENPYGDRVEGDTLVYTAGGREGDQSLGGLNRRVPQQLEIDFPIYGFEIVQSRRASRTNPKRWKFLGLLEYLHHYTDSQLDVNRNLRQVWIFEFRIHREMDFVPLDTDVHLMASILNSSRDAEDSANQDRELDDPGLSTEHESSFEDSIALESVRSKLFSLSPEEFEHLIKDVLVATGFERVDVTRYSQDGGIDVNAHVSPSIWPLKNLLLQVQAKKWRHTVGRRDVAELRGSLQPFAQGALVTTSQFSKAAIKESAEVGKLPIVLVNGYSLASIVKSMSPQLSEISPLFRSIS